MFDANGNLYIPVIKGKRCSKTTPSCKRLIMSEQLIECFLINGLVLCSALLVTFFLFLGKSEIFLTYLFHSITNWFQDATNYAMTMFNVVYQANAEFLALISNSNPRLKYTKAKKPQNTFFKWLTLMWKN